VLWFALFLATKWFALAGAGMIAAGVVVFLVRAKAEKKWPFESA
jgi:hypothetical protein